MALPSSPPLSLSDILTELGRLSAGQSLTGAADERALCGVASGAISFSDYLGKSSISDIAIVDTFSITATDTWSKTGVSFGPDFSGRRIVCVAYGSNNSSITQFSAGVSSIGGVTTVQRQDTSIVFGGSGAFNVATANPTGTSGTVQGSVGGILAAVNVVVIAVKGLTSNTPDDYGYQNDGAHPLSSITSSGNGVFIGGFFEGSDATSDLSFTGTAGLVKQSDTSHFIIYGWATGVSSGAKTAGFSGGGSSHAVGVVSAFHTS